MIIDYSAGRLINYLSVYDREQPKKMKATEEQIKQAIIDCLTVQPLTKDSLISDVILKLSNGKIRAFMANYSDNGVTDGRVKFIKDFEPCLKSLARADKVRYVYKKKSWFIVR
jgi:hypothetical protein